LARVNEERAKKGAKPLTLDATLTKMAQFKSEDMANNNYFSHPNLQGQEVNEWKKQFGFQPMVAENIAYSTEGTMDNLANLLKSPGHYANMVDPRYEIFGVGIAFMSFTVGDKDVGQVLREQVGNYSFSFSVYGDVGLESLKKNLVSRLQELPGAKGYGFGLAQDKDGMIRLTVVIKK